MEKRGIPVATVCTDEFSTLGRAQVKFLGMSALPIVTIPHPNGGLRSEEVRHNADAALDQVIEALVKPRKAVPVAG